MGYDVFISYSHKDKKIADAVCGTLEARGIRCWIAPRDVPSGAGYGGAIIDAIRETRVMVVVFTSRSNQSPQVLREIERAVNNGDTIIPFRVEDVVPSKDLEYFISALHWLDAMTPPLENHIATLAERIHVLLQEPLSTEGGRATAPPAATSAPELPGPKRTARAKLPVFAATAVLLAAGLAWWLVPRAPPSPPATAIRMESPPAGAQIIGLPFMAWSSEGIAQENLGFEVSIAEEGKPPVVERKSRQSFNLAGRQGTIRWKVRPVWESAGVEKFGDWSEERHFTAYPSSLHRIIATREIRVGIAEEDGIFVHKAGGELSGYEIELLRQIGASILRERQISGVPKISYKLHVWSDDYFKALEKDGSLDLLASGISIVPQRERDFKLVFSKPVARFPQTIVTASGTVPFADGKLLLTRIGVPSPSTNETLARELLGAEADARLVVHTGSGSYDRMLGKLMNRELDGVVMDKPYAVQKIAAIKAGAGVELSTTDLDESRVPGVKLEEIGFALRVSDAQFREEMNKQLDRLTAEKEALMSKYLPKDSARP